MPNKFSFSIDNAEMIEENPNSNFAVVALDFFASGNNLNSMYVSEETLHKTAETIKNCPLVWKYDEVLDDVYTHDKDEVPCGFVPETSEIVAKKLEDGRTMLSVVAYVWKRYTGSLLEIFKRDGGKKPVSVEIIVYEMKRMANGLKELLDFRYEGITVLGSFVTPAIPMANAEILVFSELEKEYIEAYAKEFSDGKVKVDTSFLEELHKYNEDSTYVTFPYKSLEDINSALKGITPPISLSQANEIAKQADSIEEDGWAIAISNFKKTHKVKDGKWVKKSNKEMSMGIKKVQTEKPEVEQQEVEAQEELEKETEEFEQTEAEQQEEQEEQETEKPAIEQHEAKDEKDETSEEDEKDEPSDNDEGDNKEDNKDDEKEEVSKHSIWANFDMEKISKLLDGDEEFASTLEELEKGEEADPEVVLKGMFGKLDKYENSLKVLNEELEELKKFKADVEKSQKDFAVEQTIQELSLKVVIPEDAREEMLEEAEKYSLENLEGWKNYCKARSFDFALKETTKTEYTKVGIPYRATKKSSDDLWK